ncbi:hypothetical protein ACGFWI_28225 [Streptomyces sp. NPDC048434]|uniref:hypothetical protein n=1 Tax=Streptomyces sp. NPDC048434 TaxID=3365549 RepID=UPI003718C19D
MPPSIDPDMVRVDERWESREQHDAALLLPEAEAEAAIAEALPLLTGGFTGQERTVVGGVGV